MSKASTLFLAAAILLGCAGAATCGATIYGLTGLIETPDDVVAEPNGVTFTGRYIADLGDSKINLVGYGGTIGIMPKFEIGAVAMDTDLPGAKAEGVFSAKYRVMDEAVDRPSITLGVVDATHRLGKASGDIGSASGFLVVGRNLSSAMESWGGLVSKPLRGTIGFGTGVYKGGFAGLDWSASSKVDLIAEYLTKGIRQKGTFNAGLRVNAFGRFSVEVGALGLKDFYTGATYTMSTY